MKSKQRSAEFRFRCGRRNRAARAQKEKVVKPETLSQVDKQIAANAGISHAEFAGRKAGLASKPSDYGLTADELAVCRNTNMKPREFAVQKAALKGATAIAAGDRGGTPTGG